MRERRRVGGRSPWAILLTLLLTLQAAGQTLRLVQRAVWLLTEFRPLGIALETGLMAAHETWVVLTWALSVLSAVGAVGLFLCRREGGGRLLRRVEGLRAWGCLLGAALAVGCVAGIDWACVHYRLSVAVIGWCGIVGACAVVLLLFSWRFHRNLARVLGDLMCCVRTGRTGSAVRCSLYLQGLVAAAMQLVPLAMVLLENALVAMLAANVPLLKAADWRQLLGNGLGSVNSMYTVECLLSVLGGGVCLLCGLLYVPYRRRHDELPRLLGRDRMLFKNG